MCVYLDMCSLGKRATEAGQHALPAIVLFGEHAGSVIQPLCSNLSIHVRSVKRGAYKLRMNFIYHYMNSFSFRAERRQ